jgi:hypothetical protein
MHPRVLSQRSAAALARVQSAAQVLAHSEGLPEELLAGLAAWDRDRDTREMLRLEATADLLEALAEKVQERSAPPKPARPAARS